MARKTFISLLKRTTSKASTSTPNFPSPLSTPTTPTSSSSSSSSSSFPSSISASKLSTPIRRRSRISQPQGLDIYTFKKLLNRAKDGRAGPIQIVDAMFGLGQVLPTDIVRRLAVYFVDVLGEMVAILVERDGKATESKKRRWRKGSMSSNEPVDARLIHPRSWTVMMFLTQGPQGVRYKLAKREYVDVMVGALKGDQADTVVVEHVGNVLKKLVAEDPKTMCELLGRSPGLVKRVVEHVQVEGMADLLPRLISRQGFATRNRYIYTKANKKGVAMLGQAHVQKMLAERFVGVAKNIAFETQDLVVAQHVVDAMSGICVRAMLTPRKEVDPEEEDDDKYVCHLGIVTSSTFNSALDNLNLLVSVEPLVTVLDCALESKNENLILSAFKLVTTILGTIRSARDASDEEIQETANELSIESLENIIVDRLDTLVEMIGKGDDNARGIGSVRLAAIELITSLIKVQVSEAHVANIAKSGILATLLQLYVKYQQSSILHQEVSSAVVDSFTYSISKRKPISKAWIESGNILSVLVDLWDRFTDPKMKAIYQEQAMEMISTIRDRLVLDSDLKRQMGTSEALDNFNRLCQGPVRKLQRQRPKPLGGRNPSRMDTTIGKAEELATGEDFGQRIHSMSQLEDAASKSRANDADATEMGVLAQIKGQAKYAKPSGFSKWRKSFS